METLKLKKPLKINGEDIKEIKLDFSKMTGRSLLECEALARSLGDQTPAITFSMTYQTFIASRASGLKYDDLLELGGGDYTRILSVVNGFLFVGG